MSDTRSTRTDWKFMLPLVLGTMMNPLNSTMLTTALASICLHFSENLSAGALLITPLYIAASIGQPLMGKLADIYNPKTINRLGFFIVLLGAIIALLARSFSWLIVSRVLFGLGTSAAYPSAMAIIANRYATGNRSIPGNILGIITLAAQVIMVLGPLMGGLLTELLGWQGVFLINLPWALTGLFLLKNVPSVERPPAQQKVSLFKKVDVPGIFFFGVFQVLLLICLTQRDINWVFLLAVIFSFAAFFFWEIRQTHPFVDIRLLGRKPSLLLVYIRTLGTNYILYLLLYALPQWVEAVKLMSPSQTGLIMLPMSLMSAIAALLVPRLKKLLLIDVLGVLSLIVACVFLLLLNVQSSVITLLIATMIAGLAIGINIIANQTSLSAEAPREQTGVSFGLYRTFGYMGAIVSGIQMKTLFHSGVPDQSLHACGWYAMASCGMLTVLYFIRPKSALQ